MLFNSITFLLFFPTVCVLYFCIPSSQLRLRNLFLLAASYYFYMNWEPAYALLLLTSTVITYLAARGIGHFKEFSVHEISVVNAYCDIQSPHKATLRVSCDRRIYQTKMVDSLSNCRRSHTCDLDLLLSPIQG